MSRKTIDELYEAYMDDTTSFAEDIYDWFGGGETGLTAKEWETDYGMYLPSYDPTQVKLAGRTRDLDYKKARDILDISTKVDDRIYDTEVDTISTGLESELTKGKAVSGSIGLRSGTLEAALEDTMVSAGNKVKNLGDRLGIQAEEDKNTYNAAMVDAALDFEKIERQEKEELYDRTMAAIMRLADDDAFGMPRSWADVIEEADCDYCFDRASHLQADCFVGCLNDGGAGSGRPRG